MIYKKEIISAFKRVYTPIPIPFNTPLPTPHPPAPLPTTIGFLTLSPLCVGARQFLLPSLLRRTRFRISCHRTPGFSFSSTLQALKIFSLFCPRSGQPCSPSHPSTSDSSRQSSPSTLGYPSGAHLKILSGLRRLNPRVSDPCFILAF